MKTTILAVLAFTISSLAMKTPAEAQVSNPTEFLGLVEAYLSMIDHMREIVSDPRSALLLAQNSVKELYNKKGQKAEAIPELRRILEGLEDPAVRTAVRFAIADIYKDTGQTEKALEELRMIVSENKARLDRAK